LDARSRMQTELWIGYRGFIVAWFWFFFVIEMMKPARRNVSSLVFVAFAVAAVYAITVGFVMRKKLFAQSARALPADRQKALGRWRAAHIIGFSCAINPTILGVVLKFLGASWSVPRDFFCRKLSLSHAVETALELWLFYDCRNCLNCSGNSASIRSRGDLFPFRLLLLLSFLI
jgi:hypothetical protein